MMGPDTSPGGGQRMRSDKVKKPQEKHFHTDCKLCS